MLFKDVYEFQNIYQTREEREDVLRKLSREEINHLISTCNTLQAKMYYSRFLNGED